MLSEFEIGMNFSNPQEHVPEAERNNRVIKERVRATYHRLPYKQITKTMTIILVMDSAKKVKFLSNEERHIRVLQSTNDSASKESRL